MKKVISYSIFGERERYLNGAIQNAILSKNLFPEWDIIFYVWDKFTFSKLDKVLEICKKINPNIKIEEIHRYSDSRLKILNPKMLRYLVHDREDYDFYLVRDIDSPLTLRLRKIIDWVINNEIKFGCCMDWFNLSCSNFVSSLIFGRTNYQFNMLDMIEKFNKETSYFHSIKDHFGFKEISDLKEELIMFTHKEYLRIDPSMFCKIPKNSTIVHLFYVDEVFLRWLLENHKLDYTLITNNTVAIQKAIDKNLNYKNFPIEFLPRERNIEQAEFFNEFSLF